MPERNGTFVTNVLIPFPLEKHFGTGLVSWAPIDLRRPGELGN